MALASFLDRARALSKKPPTSKPRRGADYSELLPGVALMAKAGHSARAITAEIRKDPKWKKCTEDAIYRWVCRQIDKFKTEAQAKESPTA